MTHFPHHHPACFCFVCRGSKPGHPSDRCHCDRCITELAAARHRFGDMPPQCIAAADWCKLSPYISMIEAAGYYISPVGEIEGDVYVEMEAEAVPLWEQLYATT